MGKQNLSVVLLSFNTRDITDKCLSQLQKSIEFAKRQSDRDIEVIVLDNNSTDGSVEMIRHNHPWVRCIANGTNDGFSKGNNIAARECTYETILFLNSDVFLRENTLHEALNIFYNHPEYAVLGCLLKDEKNRFQSAGGYLPTFWNQLFWQTGMESLPFLNIWLKPFHLRSDYLFKRTRQIGWVMGAFFMIRRDVFQKLSGFDENIFMYAEEVELCIRVAKAGYKTGYTNKISAVHIGSASQQDHSFEPLKAEILSILYIYRKHFPDQLKKITQIIKLGCNMRIAYNTIFPSPKKEAYTQILDHIDTKRY